VVATAVATRVVRRLMETRGHVSHHMLTCVRDLSLLPVIDRVVVTMVGSKILGW
jgi:hypothetical protein